MTPGKLVYHDAKHSYWFGGKRVKSASKVAGIAADGFAIEQYGKRMVAIGMTLDPTFRERIAVDLENKTTINDICQEAANTAKANGRAQRGVQRHRVFELGLLGETSKFITDQQIADWKVLERTLDRYGLTPMMDRVEQFVAWPKHGVVGRYDAYLGYRGAPALFDLKGGENAVKYPHGTAVQLWLYRNAPHTSKTIVRNGDKSEVTEWTTMPAGADEDNAYVIYCDDHHDVGELWRIDLNAARSGGELALGIVDWRKSYNYGRDIASQVAAPTSQVEQPSTGEVSAPSPVDNIEEEVQALTEKFDAIGRRKMLRHRYDLLNDEQKADYTARKKAIDTNDLDAVERLLDEVEPFQHPMQELRQAQCRSCSAPIYWAKTKTGKAMPINIEPASSGTLLLQGDTVFVHDPGDAVDFDQLYYVSHFATCPNASTHRKKAPPDEGPDVNLCMLDALQTEFERLSDEAKFWIATLTAQGRKAGVDWRPNALPTVRRYELARGIVKLAKTYSPNVAEHIVSGLLEEMGCNDVELLGAAIGTLDHTEAARFAALVDDYLSTGSAA